MKPHKRAASVKELEGSGSPLPFYARLKARLSRVVQFRRACGKLAFRSANHHADNGR